VFGDLARGGRDETTSLRQSNSKQRGKTRCQLGRSLVHDDLVAGTAKLQARGSPAPCAERKKAPYDRVRAAKQGVANKLLRSDSPKPDPKAQACQRKRPPSWV